MASYDYVDRKSPPVFSPKVTPDPDDAQRLEEKLQQARVKLKWKPDYRQSSLPESSMIIAAARRIG